ncbi:MAG TPA: class I SAM-dependent methyltransferase [Candidatus Acidoferrales bacterium]
MEAIAQAVIEQPISKAAARVTVRTSCRSCGGSHLVSAMDFGNLYVSNFPDIPESALWPQVPLELLLCRQCGLVQLRHTTPPEWLYRRYWYKSGVSATMRAALADITAKASRFAGLKSGDAVLDIGCNDGTLLRSYPVLDLRRTGFEPAENLAPEAAVGTDRIVNAFFSARPILGEQFQVITSIAMFYDLEDPNTFVADVASVLAEEGVWIIEMHYLPQVLARNAFDAICHEHLEYYSLSSLEPLLERHGLVAADVETNDVNGGSLRIYIVHRDCPAASVPARRFRVEALRARERSANLLQPRTYSEFHDRVSRIGERLCRYVESERERNNEVSVYGASTKGNTLLQVFGLDRRLVRSAAERNPEKWGKYTVGTWIPIVSEAEARAHANDFLVLPWHFLNEIQTRERDFLQRGGKLIVPLPTPYVIDAAGRHGLDC